jgi:acetyltransferase-like isoleucine patch superfamily enzyme
VSYKSFQTKGIPFVSIAIGGTCAIGENLAMNNGARGNPIGCFERCTIFVDKGARLVIGDNFRISQAALVCHVGITIGNNVKIGGGVSVYDTDFHSVDPHLRVNAKTDFANKIKKTVQIKDNVFIGAHSIILKGVTIGENSVIGAGSVVTKSVPANQIWAGNPAKFIKSI